MGTWNEADLGAAIRARRMARGLTLRELGESAGLDVSQLSKVERGLCRTTVNSYGRLAEALGWSEAELWRHARRLRRPAA